MVLIIGGRYQGKLDFARTRFSLSDADIQICTEETDAPDARHRCIAYLDLYALNRVHACVDPLVELMEMTRREDAIFIVTDISCGVVPVDDVARAWREANGRMTTALARECDEVWRLFCGIPQRLK